MTRTGLDVLARERFARLRDKRVGLVVNQSSVDANLRHIVRLCEDAGVAIKALFGPEHGLHGAAQDMEPVDGVARHARLGVPIYSLYARSEASLRPQPQMLAGLDTLVFDIQDIGSRYYTFVYTMAYCMEAAKAAGLDVVVLDRPNPLNGVAIEGGAVGHGFRSFVGRYDLPQRHGMTAGELAGLFNAGIGCKLEVVACEGLERAMWFDDTRLPWVLPSPNMPTLDTATVYPGMCLIEGTELSEGRGTTRPFELFGAPFVDPERLADTLASYRLPGVVARATSFTPTFQKHAGKPCGGVQLHVTDRERFLPLRTGVACLVAVRATHGAELQWRTRPYEFVDHPPAIDLLAGTARLREAIDAGAGVDAAMAVLGDRSRSFVTERAPYLLYE